MIKTKTYLGNLLAFAPVFWADRVYINTVLASRQDRIALRDNVRKGMSARITVQQTLETTVVHVETEVAA